tara:strand:+ start:978 stop:1814 length:837 start_codon:yes stop_codon:yes gene_type:complete
MSTLKELLVKDSSKYICRVKIGNLLIPYTNSEKISIDNNTTNISLFNIITEQVDTIDIESIDNYTILHEGNQDKNKTAELEFFNEYKEIIKDETIYNKVLNQYVVNYSLLKLLKLFNFSIDGKTIVKNEPFGENKPAIVNSYIEIIQNKVDKTLIELDELLTQDLGEEDIEDINSIKEIFSDVVSEIDTTEFNTFTDLYDNWPPLLLPVPDVIEDAFKSNNCMLVEESTDDHTEVIKTIDKIHDKNILSEFLKILKKNKNKLISYHYNTLYNAINKNL